ncbi:ABC transporter permease [Marinobacter sp. JSM 1782161]|uniref:ABC transporter permease n=1 Tax=Marinobacter sp. JSM 1782161 TaxID=2685906 RepID=UPI001403F59A|nr:ABC transporter permease [Marinobacter sp. JSM 1782161]
MSPVHFLSLALSSLWHRRGLLGLVVLTLTLSVTLMLGVQYLRTEVKDTFSRTISGTDLIIGARAGQLNLLLYTVFHMGDATNNIRWSTFETLADDERIDWLVPISLGDSYEGYRVVGTSEAFPKHFRYGRDQRLALHQGAWFSDLFDVVLGATVARETGHGLGDRITLAHGTGSVSFMKHDTMPFAVSGVLAPTGTPVDRAVYISLAGMEAIHVGWQAGIPIPGRTPSADAVRERDLTPDAITAAYAGIGRKVLTFQVQRAINESDLEPLSAILPGVALSELWRLMGQFEKALVLLSGFVVVISLVGLIAVLLAIQRQRQREIAILRAVGASPLLIAGLYALECVLLALLACALALLFGAVLLQALAPWLLSHWGIALSLRWPDSQEWLLLGAVPVLALLVSLAPAWQAYRGSLSEGLSESA